MKSFFLGLFILIVQLLNAQGKNKFSFSYGIAANDLFRTTSLDGSASYNGETSKVFELGYSRKINKLITIKSSFAYTQSEFIIRPAPTGVYVLPAYSTIELISVPVYANFNFGDYLFLDGGFITDFEINRLEERSIDNQTGIGFGIGVGIQYGFKQFGVFINPFFNVHSIIAFKKEKYQQHLTERGIRLGLSYSF